MDRPARSQHSQEPPGGEYVVRYERPYPARLDRAFRVGAVVVAVPILAIGLAVAGFGLYAVSDVQGASATAGLGILLAALAHGAVRAIGLIVTSIVGGLRRKQYVVDWQDDPPRR